MARPLCGLALATSCQLIGWSRQELDTPGGGASNDAWGVRWRCLPSDDP